MDLRTSRRPPAVPRAVGEPNLDHASMRAGVIIGLGVFLGVLVRRLAEQHDRLQGILDSTRDLIVTIDDTGTIQSINAASQHIFRRFLRISPH